MSSRCAAIARITRTCGAITTSPSTDWAVRCAIPAGLDCGSRESMLAVLTQYPRARAAASIDAMLDAGPYIELEAARIPMVCDLLVTSARAARFGRYWRSAITCCTR